VWLGVSGLGKARAELMLLCAGQVFGIIPAAPGSTNIRFLPVETGCVIKVRPWFARRA
jgi:hypothetical protein